MTARKIWARLPQVMTTNLSKVMGSIASFPDLLDQDQVPTADQRTANTLEKRKHISISVGCPNIVEYLVLNLKLRQKIIF